LSPIIIASSNILLFAVVTYSLPPTTPLLAIKHPRYCVSRCILNLTILPSNGDTTYGRMNATGIERRTALSTIHQSAHTNAWLVLTESLISDSVITIPYALPLNSYTPKGRKHRGNQTATPPIHESGLTNASKSRDREHPREEVLRAPRSKMAERDGDGRSPTNSWDSPLMPRCAYLTQCAFHPTSFGSVSLLGESPMSWRARQRYCAVR